MLIGLVKCIGTFISDKLYLNCGIIPVISGDISLEILNKTSIYSSGIEYVTGGILNIQLPTVYNLFKNAATTEKIIVNTNFNQQIPLIITDKNLKYSDSTTVNTSAIPILTWTISENINISQLIINMTAKNSYGLSPAIDLKYNIVQKLGYIINTILVNKINLGYTSTGTNQYFTDEVWRKTQKLLQWNSKAILQATSLQVIPGVGLTRQNNNNVQYYYRLFKSAFDNQKMGGTFVFEGITKDDFKAFKAIEIAVAHGQTSTEDYTWYSLQNWWDNNIITQRRQITTILEKTDTLFAELSETERTTIIEQLQNRLDHLNNITVGVCTDIIQQNDKLYVSFILFGDDDNSGTLIDNTTNSNEYIAAGKYGIYLRILADTDITATISYIGLKNTTTMEEW